MSTKSGQRSELARRHEQKKDEGNETRKRKRETVTVKERKRRGGITSYSVHFSGTEFTLLKKNRKEQATRQIPDGISMLVDKLMTSLKPHLDILSLVEPKEKERYNQHRN